ncbi:MAG: hypothetical protein DRO99_01540 [Candidatus Aenigmatarchaeota archaeon]|nr:MAG: hypothetical protein DRO99_01540 [Candidatus Aenigmarchaeota archaeon]
MDGKESFISWHGWNKLFWAIFIIICIVIFVGFMADIFGIVEVLISLVLIILGVEKLGEELTDQKLKERQDRLESQITGMPKPKSDGHDLGSLKVQAITQEYHESRKEKITRLEDEIQQMLEEIQMLKGTAPVVTKTVQSRKTRAKPAHSFERVWSDITSVASKRRSIKTLAGKSTNRILKINKDGMIVRQGKGKVSIKKSDVKAFWDEMLKDGSLNFTNEIYNNTLKRKGGIIISLLAWIPFIEYSVNPRVIHIMKGNTHALGSHKKRTNW